jgi:hypothetical protein
MLLGSAEGSGNLKQAVHQRGSSCNSTPDGSESSQDAPSALTNKIEGSVTWVPAKTIINDFNFLSRSEIYFHTAGVAGSIPVPPTKINASNGYPRFHAHQVGTNWGQSGFVPFVSAAHFEERQYPAPRRSTFLRRAP